MRLVLFTWPEFLDGEAQQIADVLAAGADVLHLRKPGATIEECARLVAMVPEELHSRIVVHDHFELMKEFGLGGVCLNGRRKELPEWLRHGMVCDGSHSLAELQEKKAVVDAGTGRPLEYVFLSPIFDSISKAGYLSGFDGEKLAHAHEEGLIDGRVVALGGVTAERLPLLKQLGFGGAAMLGAVWKQPEGRRARLIEEIKKQL